MSPIKTCPSPIPLTKLAHQFAEQRLANGAIAIDATMGNGHDTQYLAQLVAPSGWVYAFDIQESALAATKTRLHAAELLHLSTLIHDSHARLCEHIHPEHQGNVNVVMFNLGYLPGSDKTIITRSDTTLTAVKSAHSLLTARGIITILAYPGHAGGDTETLELENWLNSNEFTDSSVTCYLSQQATTFAPKLFVIEKT